ncbi:hypothetical protein CN238_13420 [Sinorhizobium meliloti]|nr:hypothetical protein CN238_13420 [Sinorhizobium meliloti]RVH30826.1 hypothetical protein CN214_12950 [Sinorhizobium meliloti]
MEVMTSSRWWRGFLGDFQPTGGLEALFQAMFTRASAVYRRMFSICDQRVARTIPGGRGDCRNSARTQTCRQAAVRRTWIGMPHEADGHSRIRHAPRHR